MSDTSEAGAPDNDSYIVPFEIPPPRLTGGPAWAQQIADRLHAMEVRQQRDRHAAANRDQKAVADLQELRKAFGEESEDGKGGSGILGRLNRIQGDVASLKDDRTKIRAAAATVIATGALLLLGFKSWVVSLFTTAAK